MYRGSTATFEFPIPFDISDISNFIISFYQGKDILIEKWMEDTDVDKAKNKVTVELSSKETLQLEPARNLLMQFRIKLKTGKEIVTKELITYVYDTEYEGELE